jgi:hypothetical protein
MNNFQKDIIDFVKRQLSATGVNATTPNYDRLVETAVGSLPGAQVIRLIAMRRAMRAAGAVSDAGIGIVPQTQITVPNLFATSPAIASRYRSETNSPNFVRDQIAYLAESFDYTTPVNGSIFWSGIDKTKLVAQVKAWNLALTGQLFGQLECTTDAQFIDDAFDWETAGATGQYWAAVSEALGNAARGHVTSIQLYGLQQRASNIFRHKELPAMLEGMKAEILRGATPSVTDISIVVAEPWCDPMLDCRTFTNQAIATIPILQSAQNAEGWLESRDPAQTLKVADTRSIIPDEVMNYWVNKPNVGPSAASVKIANDIENLKR